MTNNERDKLAIEMHMDIKWIKAWTVEHNQKHAKYIYMQNLILRPVE